ncbi:MAG: cytochrome c family protein [Deltaproteobacteria bacterium]|nr:cytochrome c family protein [Deltaproteobacteria bacterium]
MFLLIGIFTLVSGAEAAVKQPVQFNHQKHATTFSLPCNTCHTSFETKANSGYPKRAICAQCHLYPMGESKEEEKLREFIQKDKPLNWKRVTRLAKHVYYSHRRHVMVAKIKCSVCHGGIAQLTSPPDKPQVALTMAFCLDCHKTEHFEINEKSLLEIRQEEFGTLFRKELRTLESRKFRSREDFFAALDETISSKPSEEEKALILKYTFPSKPISTDCIACHR